MRSGVLLMRWPDGTCGPLTMPRIHIMRSLFVDSQMDVAFASYLPIGEKLLETPVNMAKGRPTMGRALGIVLILALPGRA